ncbi:hypothetical protein [Alloyangia pacifica]|uniref:hypothetical protein n=1 Tax=Alloyangia pacifica TaxID=311180 RepID=UPI00131F09BA|nr:hypothetical protein [Alloyangia pacifica]
MKIAQAILGVAVSLAPLSSLAQDGPQCPCTPYPFEPDPPCFDICAAVTTTTVPLETLSASLELTDEAIFEILEVKDQGFPRPASLSEAYSEEVQEIIRSAFIEADQDTVQQMISEYIAPSFK